MPVPSESEEIFDFEKWRKKSKDKLLTPSPCISSWTDICGFGNLLLNNKWDLINLQKSGAIHLLNEFHTIIGRPLLVNIDPLPNDKVIVLNDGIAHTIDLLHIDKLEGYVFLMYLRDLIIAHFMLQKVTKSYKVGVRTILAGGQRVQYSPSTTTGHSYLHYDELKISEFGKQL